MTIPCGYAQPADDDSVYLPVGLQILGGMYCEEQVLSVGHVLEQAMQEKVAERKVG
jgi:amidase